MDSRRSTMSAKRNPVERAAERIDKEFSADHGTTVSEKAYEHEAHPEMNPQSPGELRRKVAAEGSEGHGPVEKVKRALEEIDRDVSGEYERRDDAGGKR
jgi:hypothetical protein